MIYNKIDSSARHIHYIPKMKFITRRITFPQIQLR